MPMSGQIRATDLTYTAGGNLTAGGWDVRIELWPVWLSIAEQAAARSSSARSANPGTAGAGGFDAALVDELRHAMTAISAAAFTLEAFTASLVDTEPATNPPPPQSGRRTPQYKYIAAAWDRAFDLGATDLSAMRSDLKQIFTLRNEAVHVKSAFVSPGMDSDFGVALHPMFLWFSHGNATSTVQQTRKLLSAAVGAPRERYASIARWAKAQIPLLTS